MPTTRAQALNHILGEIFNLQPDAILRDNLTALGVQSPQDILDLDLLDLKDAYLVNAAHAPFGWQISNNLACCVHGTYSNQRQHWIPGLV